MLTNRWGTALRGDKKECAGGMEKPAAGAQTKVKG